MITKILLTFLVIIVAFFFIRRQSVIQKSVVMNAQKESEKVSTKARFDISDLRIGAYMFVVLMLMLSSFLYYQDRQEGRQLLTVKLYSGDKDQPVEYRVFKYQLDDQRFITTEGVRVKVSDNERMEVVELNEAE